MKNKDRYGEKPGNAVPLGGGGMQPDGINPRR